MHFPLRKKIQILNINKFWVIQSDSAWKTYKSPLEEYGRYICDIFYSILSL